jgi:large subunit ribosomal protein L18
MKVQQKLKLKQHRHWRVRKKIIGTSDRPRLTVKFSGKNIYVQVIDDGSGRTLASASTKDKTLENREKLSANLKSAKLIGEIVAKRARAQKIEKVVFDRGSNSFHGKAKVLADSAREIGLKF